MKDTHSDNIDKSMHKGPDPTLFVNLLSANYYRIHSFILSLVASQADADDITQETSTVMWRKFDEFTPGTDFVSWAFAIAKFQVLKYRKKKKLRVILDEDILESLSEGFQRRTDNLDTRLEILGSCLKKLTPDDRNFVDLRYQDSMTAQRVALRIGIPVYQVYRKLARINGLLLRCVQRHLHVEGLS